MGLLDQFRSIVGLPQGPTEVVHTGDVLSRKPSESGNSKTRVKKTFRQHSYMK